MRGRPGAADLAGEGARPPGAGPTPLRPAQVTAIAGVERSLAQHRFDRSLVQMATGAGSPSVTGHRAPSGKQGRRRRRPGPGRLRAGRRGHAGSWRRRRWSCRAFRRWVRYGRDLPPETFDLVIVDDATRTWATPARSSTGPPPPRPRSARCWGPPATGCSPRWSRTARRRPRHWCSARTTTTLRRSSRSSGGCSARATTSRQDRLLRRDPKGQLRAFSTSTTLRVAVTVDKTANGTDVKSLECVLFLRGVRSASYFERRRPAAPGPSRPPTSRRSRPTPRRRPGS